MRITQNIMFGNFMRDVNTNRLQMSQIQSALSSGKSVRIASDNPVAFQRSRNIEEDLRKHEQYQDNIDNGLRQSRMAQEALDEVVDRLVDIKQILTQGATDTAGESVRKNLADEVSGIRDHLISTLNLSYGDRYLFGGTNTAQPPFVKDELAPGGVQNLSNPTAPRIQAADGVSIDVSITGTELADTPAGDLFEILMNIEDALLANDTDALNALMPDIDKTIEHTAFVTSRLGNNINRMEFMFEHYESSNIGLKSDISRLVDTDFAQSFSDLQRVQVAYESAMAVHSQMFKNTLLDYL